MAMTCAGRVEQWVRRCRATADHCIAASLGSARSFSDAVPLGRSLTGLGASARSPRFTDRDPEPLASRDSACAFRCHDGPHLAAEFRRYLPVDKRLLNRGRQLTLPANLSRTSVAAHSLDVCRLDLLNGVGCPSRRIRILVDLKSRPLFAGRFPVASGRDMAYSLETLRDGGNPSLPYEFGRSVEPDRCPATLSGSIHHRFDRGRAFGDGAETHEHVGEGHLAGMVSKLMFLLHRSGPFVVQADFKRRSRAALFRSVPPTNASN